MARKEGKPHEKAKSAERRGKRQEVDEKKHRPRRNAINNR
jgi:hypothetical protein